MLAVFVNMAAVIAGSLLGMLFSARVSEKLQHALMCALALCAGLIGITSAIRTEDVLCIIVCMTVGTAIGELCRLDDGIEHVGDALKSRLLKKGGGSRFTEGFVSACILFCVGSMTIVGSLEAGINHNYSIIFAKSAMDCVAALAFGAAMGIGVTFSAAFILVFQGGLTLLAGMAAPYLSPEVVREMSAVGGTIVMGMSVNMLGLRPERIKVANMLPAIFLPLLYFPACRWLVEVLG